VEREGIADTFVTKLRKDPVVRCWQPRAERLRSARGAQARSRAGAHWVVDLAKPANRLAGLQK
jgi:hypothetical protein